MFEMIINWRIERCATVQQIIQCSKERKLYCIKGEQVKAKEKIILMKCNKTHYGQYIWDKTTY